MFDDISRIRSNEKNMWPARKYVEVRNVLLLHVSLLGNGTGNQTDRPTYARTFTYIHVHARSRTSTRSLVQRNALGLAMHSACHTEIKQISKTRGQSRHLCDLSGVKLSMTKFIAWWLKYKHSFLLCMYIYNIDREDKKKKSKLYGHFLIVVKIYFKGTFNNINFWKSKGTLKLSNFFVFLFLTWFNFSTFISCNIFKRLIK